MKAKELRIGNYVGSAFNKMKIPAIVTSLSEYYCETFYMYSIPDIRMLADFQTVGYKDIYGIPLTEKWLYTFGFEKIEKRPSGSIYRHSVPISSSIVSPDHYRAGFFDIYSRDQRKTVKRLEYHKYYYLGRDMEFEYIHQLQNFYYALTGNEIELKHEIDYESIDKYILEDVDNNII